MPSIAAASATQGYTVEKSQVRMPAGHLKQVGDYPVSIALHTDVAVEITVSITGEN